MASTSPPLNIKEWLREACASYSFDIDALLRKKGTAKPWPITLASEEELWSLLESHGHTASLPSESGALANIIEVSLVDHLIRCLDGVTDAHPCRGMTRVYPDLEITGSAFGDGYHAIDIKAARLTPNGRSTMNAITLYTADTYFRHPATHVRGMLRPFGDYTTHLDVISLFTFNPNSQSRVTNLRLLVCEPWTIASRTRSSSTRNYIGAVRSVAKLERGQGAFASAEEFYAYWRAYDFGTVPKEVRKAKKKATPAGEQMKFDL